MMLVGEFLLLFNTKTEHLRINQELKKQHADSRFVLSSCLMKSMLSLPSSQIRLMRATLLTHISHVH